MTSDDTTQMSEDEMVDKYYKACEEAKRVKFGSYLGKQLLAAAKKGDLDRVKEIVSMPADEGGLILLRLLAADEQGNSAVHLAARRGHLEVVEYLLSAGLSGEGENTSGQTALDLAVAAGHEHPTQLLRNHAIARSKARQDSVESGTEQEVKHGGDQYQAKLFE